MNRKITVRKRGDKWVVKVYNVPGLRKTTLSCYDWNDAVYFADRIAQGRWGQPEI